MMLHPEDVRYWAIWVVLGVVAFVAARWYLIEPIVQAIKGRS